MLLLEDEICLHQNKERERERKKERKRDREGWVGHSTVDSILASRPAGQGLLLGKEDLSTGVHHLVCVQCKKCVMIDQTHQELTSGKLVPQKKRKRK